jgi:hypothetical protein
MRNPYQLLPTRNHKASLKAEAEVAADREAGADRAVGAEAAEADHAVEAEVGVEAEVHGQEEALEADLGPEVVLAAVRQGEEGVLLPLAKCWVFLDYTLAHESVI